MDVGQYGIGDIKTDLGRDTSNVKSKLLLIEQNIWFAGRHPEDHMGSHEYYIFHAVCEKCSRKDYKMHRDLN